MRSLECMLVHARADFQVKGVKQGAMVAYLGVGKSLCRIHARILPAGHVSLLAAIVKNALLTSISLPVAGIDVSRILTPAATLRPGAAQTCQTKQDHGLETGLDLPELIGACASALPDDGAAPQPVYYETSVYNVRCL